jgi:hypothetical protein
MTPLRQKLIRQMDLKNLSPHTRRSYLNAVNRARQVLPEISGDHYQ